MLEGFMDLCKNVDPIWRIAMQAVEFQTTLKEIITAVPEQQRRELQAYHGDNLVRVIVLASTTPILATAKDRLADAQAKGYDDFLEYLIDYPLEVDHPQRLTRDQLHER